MPRTAVGVVNRAGEKNENLSPSEFPALSGMKRLLVLQLLIHDLAILWWSSLNIL